MKSVTLDLQTVLYNEARWCLLHRIKSQYKDGLALFIGHDADTFVFSHYDESPEVYIVVPPDTAPEDTPEPPRRRRFLSTPIILMGEQVRIYVEKEQ